MTGTIGPSQHVPGDLISSIPGVMCDNHENRLAVARLVGETDSFGSEVADLCQDCIDNCHADTAGVKEKCHRCSRITTGCNDVRDPEEGLYGRLYTMCEPCREEMFAPQDVEDYDDEEELHMDDEEYGGVDLD